MLKSPEFYLGEKPAVKEEKLEEKPNFLEGVITAIEEDKIKIKLENQEEISWPIEKSPFLKLGEKIKIELKTYRDKEQTKYVEMLNEILKVDSEE